MIYCSLKGCKKTYLSQPAQQMRKRRRKDRKNESGTGYWHSCCGCFFLFSGHPARGGKDFGAYFRNGSRYNGIYLAGPVSCTMDLRNIFPAAADPEYVTAGAGGDFLCFEYFAGFCYTVVAKLWNRYVCTCTVCTKYGGCCRPGYRGGNSPCHRRTAQSFGYSGFVFAAFSCG